MPFFGLFHLQIAFVNNIYSLWRAPKCTDFAHLTAIIKKLQRTAFSDEKKIKNFRAAEDLLITTFTSYIVAWVTRVQVSGLGEDVASKAKGLGSIVP